MAIGLVLATSPAALAQTGAAVAVPALVKSFMAAEQAYDAPALQKLISKQYVEVSPAGEVDAYDRFLGFYAPSEKIEWPPHTVSEETVREFPGVAIEIAKISYSMKGPDGTAHTMDVRGTFVAQLEDGQYKLLSAQYTGIRPKPLKK
jgi:ketosteroid isomerase-like protein